MIEKTSFTLTKVSGKDLNEIEIKINSLGAKKIISVQPCTPDRTDTQQWYEVYYEFWI